MSSLQELVTSLNEQITEQNAEILALRTTCPFCNHLWKQHDPEDGQCDAHSNEELNVCLCGRELNWMRTKIAELSRSHLGTLER